MKTATKQHPTKEQWEQIAKNLDTQHHPVYLNCDGYLVGAVMRRVGSNKLAIQVHVNGWEFKGEWLPSFRRDNPKEMSEEARRFWMPSKKSLYSAKELKRWEKLIGKRECRRRGYYDPLIIPTPLWNRPLSLIRHLKKHNQVIEVISYDCYKEAMDALRARELGEEETEGTA